MAFNIATALSNLNARYGEVTDLVSDLFYFYDDGNSESENTNEIGDGGYDMYDGGNEIRTNLTGDGGEGGEGEDRVPYTHTQSLDVQEEEENIVIPYDDPPMDGQIVDGTTTFGSGSQYFTNMYPGMFVLAATGCNINLFAITGNIGSDGDETVVTDSFQVTVNQQLFTVYTKASGLGYDPSINHIMIVTGSEALTHTTSESGDGDDDDRIEGGNISTVFYLLLSRYLNAGGEGSQDDGPLLSTADAQAVVAKFLEIVWDGAVNRVPPPLMPRISFEVVAYNIRDILATSPPSDLANILLRLNNATVLIAGRPMKHGDRFVAEGQYAEYLRKIYVNTRAPLLRIIPQPFVDEPMNNQFLTGTLVGSAVFNEAVPCVTLTPAENGLYGAIEYSKEPFPPVFEATFDFQFNGTADAVYFYWFCDATPETENGGTSVGEEAFLPGGYIISFSEYLQEVKIVYPNSTEGVVIATFTADVEGGQAILRNGEWYTARIRYDGSSGTFSVWLGTLLILDSVVDPDFATRDLSATLFGVAARTGGENAVHRVRNLLINKTTA